MMLCLPPFHAHMNHRHYTDTWVLILVGVVVLLERFQDVCASELWYMVRGE